MAGPKRTEMPITMRAITVSPSHTFANPANPATDLHLDPKFPVPVPSASQYLIRIRSVGISRYELTWEGTYTAPLKPRISCFDVAGTVVSSPQNGKWEEGDRVFGLLPWLGQGGLAEFVVAEEYYLAAIPEGMEFAAAATLPRAALTAYQAFEIIYPNIRHNGMSMSSMNVLVTGAAGAVGRIGMQIARDRVGEGRGKVVGVARGADGRDDIVSSMEEAANLGVKFHLVFDTVGGEVLEKSIDLTTDDGIVITVGTPIPTNTTSKIKFFIVQESGEQLERIVELVQSGVIKPTTGVIVNGLSESEVCAAWSSGGLGVVVNMDG